MVKSIKENYAQDSDNFFVSQKILRLKMVYSLDYDLYLCMTGIYIIIRPQQESNLQLALRRGSLYPFNYEVIGGAHFNKFKKIIPFK